MAYKQRHLLEVANLNPSGTGTAEIVALVEKALHLAEEANKAERAAAGKERKTEGFISDFEKCPRKVGYSFTEQQVSDPVSTDSLVNFAVGKATEEAFTELLRPLGAEVYREVSVSIPVGETRVRGRIDLLCVLPEQNLLIELKSANSRSMGFMLKSGEQGRTEHRAQANGYLHASQLGLLRVEVGQALETAYEGNGMGGRAKLVPVYKTIPALNRAALVYITKDATMREPAINAWWVDYDAAWAEQHLEALANIKDLADQGIVMPRPEGYTRTKYPCSYCDFASLCWSTEG